MADSLVLSDGTKFRGTRFGAATAPVVGEVALFTGVVGWQEVLTDPAYAGKIVVFTYPHVGNYGVNEEDLESRSVTARAVVVRDLARFHSNFRATGDFRSWVERMGLSGLTGVDTRAVMIHARERGIGTGAVASSPDEGLDAMRQQGSPFDRNLVEDVQGIARLPEGNAEPPGHEDTSDEDVGRGALPRRPAGIGGYPRGEADAGTAAGHGALPYEPTAGESHPSPITHHPSLVLGVLDLGGKHSLYWQMAELGCMLRYFPWDATADEILSSGVAGLLLPPGPGDPNRLGPAVEQVKQMLGRTPVLGIGMGFQLLALALGGRVTRLKTGRHGVNYPVRSTRGESSLIAACHHSFGLDAESIPSGVDITYVDLNEGTPMGLGARGLGVWGYQFHPGRDGDGRPSPLLARFVETLRTKGDQ